MISMCFVLADDCTIIMAASVFGLFCSCFFFIN